MELLSSTSVLMTLINWTETKASKDTGSLLDASKKLGLEVIAENTKYAFMSHHESVGQNHNFTIINKHFENIWKG
jgi:hypothetical protein